MAARITEQREVASMFSGDAQKSTTSDLIEYFMRMGFEYVDVLRMLGIATRVPPRQHMEVSEWVQHQQHFDHGGGHFSLMSDLPIDN
jgi:hypothetical protein